LYSAFLAKTQTGIHDDKYRGTEDFWQTPLAQLVTAGLEFVGQGIANSLRAGIHQPELEFMTYLSFCRATVFAAILFAPVSKAQLLPAEPNAGGYPFRAEGKEEDGFRPVTSQPQRGNESLTQSERSPVRFHKAQFIVLSAAVYAASAADMHQTEHNRKQSWWYEKDLFARPLLKLPAPAYYAVGLTLDTGVNWISWKMGHSRRWRKLAPLPQMLSIVGNSYGFKSNCHSYY